MQMQEIVKIGTFNADRLRAAAGRRARKCLPEPLFHGFPPFRVNLKLMTGTCSNWLLNVHLRIFVYNIHLEEAI
jgi:hypothetical protein